MSKCGDAERSRIYNFWRRGLGAKSGGYRVADVLRVEVKQAGFDPDDEHARDGFVIRMTRHIGESSCSGDASQESHMRPGSTAQKLNHRNDCADKNAA